MLPMKHQAEESLTETHGQNYFSPKSGILPETCGFVAMVSNMITMPYEAAVIRRRRIAALVTDRYRHPPLLAIKRKWVWDKTLQQRLEEGNRELLSWLNDVSTFSTLIAADDRYSQQDVRRFLCTRINNNYQSVARIAAGQRTAPLCPPPKQMSYVFGLTATTSTRTLNNFEGFIPRE
jgi:hypothetical protein